MATTNSRYKRFGYLAEFKDVLYLGDLCIMEKPRVFNPKPLVASGR